jgi:hypothetical protein
MGELTKAIRKRKKEAKHKLKINMECSQKNGV